jgi:ATP-dependent 26S proteasome regulatory subunit
MNQIDGCEPNDQVLFVMNTNSLERLEHAVKDRPGRVDQIIQIPLPDRQERELLLRKFAHNLGLEEAGLQEVLEATAGTTPAVLKEIVKRAAVNAVERVETGSNGQQIAITSADMMLGVAQVRALRDAEVIPGTFGFREGREG